MSPASTKKKSPRPGTRKRAVVSAKPQSAPPSSSPPTDSEAWSRRIGEHRRRQVSVSAILDRTFGEPARCEPGLWERRAYLMLIGLVYEKLATCEEELKTEEIVALAKALAENRRANARPSAPKESPGENSDESAPVGELPGRFAHVVRQMYGTRLPDSESSIDGEGTDPPSPGKKSNRIGGVGG